MQGLSLGDFIRNFEVYSVLARFIHEALIVSGFFVFLDFAERYFWRTPVFRWCDSGKREKVVLKLKIDSDLRKFLVSGHTSPVEPFILAVSDFM